MTFLLIALVLWFFFGCWYAIFNLGDKPYCSKFTMYLDVLIMLPAFLLIMVIGCLSRLWSKNDRS